MKPQRDARDDPEAHDHAGATRDGAGSRTKSEEQARSDAQRDDGPEPGLPPREAAVTARENAASERERSAAAREGIVQLREETSRLREEAMRAREDAANARETAQALLDEIRDMNERLVIATVHAQTMAEEADRANRLKDEFLATVSHELRTPLNAVLGWARILGEMPLSGRAAEGAAAIHRSASTLLHIVDDLLDVARSISGKFHIDAQVVDVTAVTNQAVQSMRPDAVHRKLTLHFGSDGGVHIVRGDPARLQQIMANLLSNAFKFTPEGGTVDVWVSGSDDTVQIRVTDTGQGIPNLFLPHVFDRFRQADAATTRRHGGLGLGLAIARRLAELHGGGIEAASDGEGRGSTFTIRFPRLPPQFPVANDSMAATWPASEASNTPPTRALRPLSALRVLVVDDDEDARVLTGLVLTEAGAEVQEVSTAREALRRLKAGWPDVLVSDIGLPDEDGYALIKEWRRHEGALGGFVPALALTGYAREVDRMRTLAAGFQGYAAKPVEPQRLVASVATIRQQVLPR